MGTITQRAVRLYREEVKTGMGTITQKAVQLVQSKGIRLIGNPPRSGMYGLRLSAFKYPPEPGYQVLAGYNPNFGGKRAIAWWPIVDGEVSDRGFALTLLHELGHYAQHQDGAFPQNPLSMLARETGMRNNRVVAEEEDAWNRAFAYLEDLGEEVIEADRRGARQALANYRDKFQE